jgi:hypothetical protein
LRAVAIPGKLRAARRKEEAMHRGRSQKKSNEERHLRHRLRKVKEPKELDKLFKAAGGRSMPTVDLNVFMEEYQRRNLTLPD